MKKYIVLSVNWNPDYLWYLPLTVWAWRKFGWEPIVFYNGPQKETAEDPLWCAFRHIDKAYALNFFDVKDIPGYRSDTITQISRLYGAAALDGENYLMLGDIDLLPLSDVWDVGPHIEGITIWNHDLTDFTEIPMCFVGMPSSKWIEVMGLTSDDYNALIKRDLDSMPNAKETADWSVRWSVDQQLLTKRLNECQFKKTFINRGKLPNGYARGRVDRGSWSLDHPELIDAHLLRDCYKDSTIGRQNMVKVLQLLAKVWPEESFDWLVSYTQEFRKLAHNG